MDMSIVFGDKIWKCYQKRLIKLRSRGIFAWFRSLVGVVIQRVLFTAQVDVFDGLSACIIFYLDL